MISSISMSWYWPPRKKRDTWQRSSGRSFSQAATSCFSRFSISSLRAIGSLIASRPSRIVRGDVRERLRDHHVLRRAGGLLVGVRLREEAVLDEVVLRRRVELQRALRAVMVRDDEALGRHERRRCSRRATRPRRAARRADRRASSASSWTPSFLKRLDVLRQRHLRRHPHAARARVRAARGERGIGRLHGSCRRRCLGSRGSSCRACPARHCAAAAASRRRRAPRSKTAASEPCPRCTTVV